MDLAKPIIVDTVKTGFDLTKAPADKIEKQLKDGINGDSQPGHRENHTTGGSSGIGSLLLE